jgi:hypothetical protein
MGDKQTGKRAELAGQITNGPAVLQVYRVTTTSLISTQLSRLPPHLATNAAYGTNPIIARLRTNSYTYTNLVFERFARTRLRIWSGPISWPRPTGATCASGRSARIPRTGRPIPRW